MLSSYMHCSHQRHYIKVRKQWGYVTHEHQRRLSLSSLTTNAEGYSKDIYTEMSGEDSQTGCSSLEKLHKCVECLKSYKLKRDLNRHIREKHQLVKLSSVLHQTI